MVRSTLKNKYFILGSTLTLSFAIFFAFLIMSKLSVPRDFDEYRNSFKLSDSFLFAKDGRLLNSERTEFTKRNITWTPIDTINNNFIEKLIQQEDRRYYSHKGVDLIALLSAIKQNIESIFGRNRYRGASTITMQLAKHYYRLNTRQIVGKLQQMLGAIYLETQWSKQNILEAYLNLIYFHGEIQGIGTASLALFQKSAKYINEQEQLELLSLVKNPNAKVKTNITQFTSNSAKLAEHYHQFKRRQPQFTPNSTLNYELQVFATESLRHQLDILKDRNVHDGAVLVLDNKTKEVLAYVGNSGVSYSSTPFVDMVQATRQAGSTLKPFLYATALENNILKLNSWIEDSPIDIVFENGTYSPRNHDQQFHGWVHPGTALGSSLNVPAVKTIQLVGVENFWLNLKKLNFNLEHEPDFYGPSLALGTLDTSLWNLTHAYQSFVISNVGPFSENTKEQITWMLARSQNRTLTFGQDSLLSIQQGFAVKTGTSKDMKDNWCLGYNRDFTVGVWIGNANNSSMQNVLGVSGAAPIWREVVNFILSQNKENSVLISNEKEQQLIALEKNSLVPQAYGASKIISPAKNSIYAIDPAIPLKFQKIILEADGPQTNLAWKYKGHDLSSKLLDLQKGHQKIELFQNGKKVDESTFLVK